MNMLWGLRVEFLISAKKNERVKRAMVDFHNRLIPKMTKFTIGNSQKEEGSFDPMIYRKKDAKETGPIPG